jgi:hypothetical protein
MFTIKSLNFLNKLAEMRQDFSSLHKVAFTITVPPEMAWWYWQEFGTALYAEKGSLSGNETGYFVRPQEGKALKFYDRAAGNFRITNETFVFGIPAHHMITDLLPVIREQITEIAAEGLKQGYTLEGLRAYIEEAGVPHIVQMISDQFALKLDLPVRPNGRIGGTAAQEFDQKVQVVETSN